MVEPQIEYCTTDDGASIAYVTMGAGPIVIMLPSVYSFSASLRLIPHHKALCEAVARNFTLVQYDGRGMGLSTRERTDYSLEARLQDLDAVVLAVGVEKFSLFGWFFSGFAAMAYTARHPDRVPRLVLIDPFSSGERWFTETPAGRFNASLGPVTTEQWEHVSGVLSIGALRDRFPDVGLDTVRDANGAALRDTWTPAAFLAHRQALREIDVSGDVAAIPAPTLVISTYPVMAKLFDQSREVASAIPKARLARVEPRWYGWEERDYETLLAFLSEGVQPGKPAGGKGTVPSGTAVILFTDIADSTALTERMGDVAFRKASRALDAGLRAAIRDAGGTAIDGKLLGDGVLATFPAAAQAIDAARRCHALSGASELPLHLGIHAGDVIREEDNVFGGTVNIASRICALSAPGEILVSDVVRGMARSSAGVTFEDRGEQEMKGVGELVRVYAVRKDEA